MDYRWKMLTDFFCHNCHKKLLHDTTLPSSFTHKDLSSGEHYKRCLGCGHISKIEPVKAGQAVA